MNFLNLFLIIVLVAAERVTNATVEIYYDSLGSMYLKYEKNFVNQILNYQNFKLSAGYGKASFDIKNHDVTLLHYFPLPLPKEEKSEEKHSPMFGVTLYIAVYRGSERKDKTKCVKVEKVREYVRLVELGMKLWSGNQVKIVQGNELYISSRCLVTDEQFYIDSNKGKIMNGLVAEAEKNDKLPNVAVKWFLTDDFTGTWLGVAGLGGPSMVANRNSNAWLMSKDNIRGEDPNNGRVITLIHEYGHSCGFHHSGTNEASATGVFTSFAVVDNYYDCGSYMGNCAAWYQPPTMSQYLKVTVGSNPESWFFKHGEQGTHKYRIYAVDHPYSRYFLGTDKPYHTDDEIFDGISFAYNCLSIQIFVNESFTSKYTGAEGTSGSIMLEYRFQEKGQKGAKDFGVRITNVPNGKSNLLDANFDEIPTFDDSHIIQGMDYYPADFDTGTLRIRVTKIHKTVLKESIQKEILKTNKRNYDEPSYAEVEIECYPNKKYTKPSPPKGIPNFVFSPTFHNCEKNNDDSGYTCSRPSTTKNGWFYFVNNGNRDKNIPRIYRNTNVFLKGRNVIRSYNGFDNSKAKVCYGDSSSKCVNITVNVVSYSGINRKKFQYATVSRVKNDDVNKTIEDLGKANIIYGTNVEVSEGGRVFISDLYGNEKEIIITDKTFLEILPPLETDGFAEAEIIIKDKSGKVTYFDSFIIYQPENGNRVAVEYKENGKFELSPAVMPSDTYYTTASMLYPITAKSNNWFYYPITDLKVSDYVLVDFRGTVPKGLKMTVETDMGEYSRDLSDLGGLSSVSYKLTVLEMNHGVSSWGEINRIKFNKDVEIQNIRPVFLAKIGDQMGSVNAVSDKINFDGYTYTINTAKTEGKYIYNKVSVEINGKKYSFDTPTSKSSSVDIEEKGLSTFLVVLIIIAVVVVLIALVVIVIKCKSKSSGNAPRAAYPSAGSTYRAPPPIVGYAARGPVAGSSGGGGYAGGYAGGYRK